MIETLDGIYETVNYKQSTSLKLYDNVQYEDYPMHWHPAIEIIMPVENSYKLVFSNGEIILKENDIPTEANPVTLALLYKAAHEADEAGDTQQALDCYRMVFDLTADEEVGRIISEMES